LAIKIPETDPPPTLNVDALPTICIAIKRLPDGRSPEEDIAKLLPAVGWVDGDYWVSPYRPRTDLERFLGQLQRQQMVLPYRIAASWGADLAQKLHELHVAGMAHNDAKARNVVVNGPTEFGSCVIPSVDSHRAVSWIDFGSASRIGQGPAVGTPRWQAPELISGQDPISSAAGDVFGVSAILFFIITGERVNDVVDRTVNPHVKPWPEWSAMYREAWKSRLPGLLVDTPDRLKSAILGGLNPDADARPSAAVLSRRLEDLLGDKQMKNEFAVKARCDYEPNGYGPEVVETLRVLGYAINRKGSNYA
jgi:serine/threonine protein kinase